MEFANIIIILAVFGYAGWALYRSIKKSKEGKCAACKPKDGGCSCADVDKHNPSHHSDSNP